MCIPSGGVYTNKKELMNNCVNFSNLLCLQTTLSQHGNIFLRP